MRVAPLGCRRSPRSATSAARPTGCRRRSRSVGLPVTLLDRRRARARRPRPVRRHRGGTPRLRDRLRAGRGQRPAARLRAARRPGHRPVPAAAATSTGDSRPYPMTVGGPLAQRPAAAPGGARPGDRRDGAGPHPDSGGSGRSRSQPDRGRGLGGLGPGARALLRPQLGPGATGRCSRPTTRATRRSRAACWWPGWAGNLRLHRPQLLPPAPAGVPGAFRLFANLLALKVSGQRTARHGQADAEPLRRSPPPSFRPLRPFRPLAAVPTTPHPASSSTPPTAATSSRCWSSAFEREHPDIDVRWLDMGSQEILDRLRFERVNPRRTSGSAGRPRSSTAGVADSLLAPYRPAWADHVGPGGVGPGDLYYPAYRTPAVIAFNSRLVPPGSGAAGLGRRARRRAGTTRS